MRPVHRGPAPRQYAKYQDAAQDLQERLGDFCCYCERQIETHLAVEHITPKKPGGILHPDRLTDWNNFLLGCTNCNSRKGDTDVNLSDYLWPDTDNTFLAIEYTTYGIVRVKNTSDIIKAKAEALIKLVGLDVDPGNPLRSRKPKQNDKRYQRRKEAWDLATISLRRLQVQDSQGLREQIVDSALGRGMFSIWMTVFENDQDMRLRLISAFKGTAVDCFDSVGNPVPRPSGLC